MRVEAGRAIVRFFGGLDTIFSLAIAQRRGVKLQQQIGYAVLTAIIIALAVLVISRCFACIIMCYVQGCVRVTRTYRPDTVESTST